MYPDGGDVDPEQLVGEPLAVGVGLVPAVQPRPAPEAFPSTAVAMNIRSASSKTALILRSSSAWSAATVLSCRVVPVPGKGAESGV